MRLTTTLAVAIPLVLATASFATAAVTVGNHGGRGGNQFVHGAFGPGPVHRRHHQKFVLPYGYYDYDYPADDAFGEPPTDSPPVVSSVPAAPSPAPCQRSVEKFTVPSRDGGTKEITIINCP
jgi:hypothetical protein